MTDGKLADPRELVDQAKRVSRKSQKEIASLCGCDQSEIPKWKNGQRPIPEAAREILIDLAKGGSGIRPNDPPLLRPAELAITHGDFRDAMRTGQLEAFARIVEALSGIAFPRAPSTAREN